MEHKRPDLETIVSFCKRKGFVYPSSEIYGGYSAVYDYGSYGVELVNAIKREWWKAMVQLRQDVVGLDSGIFMNPRIWKASGHVDNFADPLTECRSCHTRMRVDHLLERLGVSADEKMTADSLLAIFDEHRDRLHCIHCGLSDLTEPKQFNLLVQSNLGNITGDLAKEPVYLRGETCQGIYVNFKNILNSNRIRIPFGIAQIGKAFRNEITARQFIFRTREFEQMEMQYFVSPDDELSTFDDLRQARWDYYLQLGLSESNLRWHEHERLVFYAKAAFDIEYNFPFGFSELEGVHARGDYDLTQHSVHSGVDHTYTDPITKELYMPHIVESSAGVGRTFLALICEAYKVEDTSDGVRTVLKLPARLAPKTVAIFPLLKNKPELVETAHKLFCSMQKHFMAEFDDSGNIGKRYRRQDEIGTPYCVTVDFATLSDNSVTVRDRDTMKQTRVDATQLKTYLSEQLER